MHTKPLRFDSAATREPTLVFRAFWTVLARIAAERRRVARPLVRELR